MADDQQDLDENKDVPETGTPTEEGAPVESKEPVDEDAADIDTDSHEAVVIAPQPSRLHTWRQKLLDHKKVVFPVAGIVLLVSVALGVPLTRYKLAGLFIKQDFAVLVVDSQNGKPVTSATVKLGIKSAQTGVDGSAKLREPSGKTKLTVSKKYYKTFTRDVLVPIGKQRERLTIRLEAIGRQVPVTITNTISGKAVAGATVKASGSEAKTDDKGEAVVVVPAGQTEVTGTVSADGYNAADVTIKVTTDKVDENTFSITPSGTVYFLSNASGKLDVIKSNLDGTGRSTVLAGTGKEDKYNTVLLSSRDWKYIALLSKRDGGDNAKIFVIDTAGDKLTTADEGDASFSIVGWSGDRLIYTVSRNAIKLWEPKKQALKSYHAPAKKLTTLDETFAEGVQYDHRREAYSSVYVLANEIIYAKSWYGGSYDLGLGPFSTADKQVVLSSVQADGSQRRVIKTYDFSTAGYLSIQTRVAEVDVIYIRHYDAGTETYEAYKAGKISKVALTEMEFYSGFPTRSVSPSGNKALWNETRDGKYVYFVADKTGENENQLGASADFNGKYGWFTDDYVILANKDSELHIMPSTGPISDFAETLKIGDFYQSQSDQNSYRYGY